MSQEKADLERLSQCLFDVLDAERERIARILHDDLGQQVASLSILTSTLKRRLPLEDKESCEQADKIREKLIALAGSMRRLSHELHPVLLEHAGPAIALRQFCEELGLETGARIAYQSTGEFRDVPLSIGLCVYRIAEQVLRSFRPERPESETIVRLTRAVASVGLSIAGKMVGLGQEDLAFECCRQRLKQFSGTLVVEHSPACGWQLAVTVPWKTVAFQA